MNTKTLKLVGSVIIVAAAFAIMFPGFLNYFFGLSRMLTIVVVTLAIASVLTIAAAKIKGQKLAKKSAETNAKTLSVGVALCCLFSSRATAQNNSGYSAPSTLHGNTVVLPRGTTFEGRFDSTIGSGFSRPGQRFTISIASPILANSTDVLIPSGSQVIGEVVEAIASAHQEIPRYTPKGTPKPLGKLRVQLTGLRTPDGLTYPLVGSLVGETSGTPGSQQANTHLGGGVGYAGTQASFEAVAPGAQNRNNRGNGGMGPKVLSRDEVMNDPIYGYGMNQNDQNGQQMRIRSLVKRGRDLVIVVGSPVSIRLDAAFKIGINQAGATEATLMPTADIQADGHIGRRFSKTQPLPPEGAAGQPAANPLPGILPDVPHASTVPQAQPAPVTPSVAPNQNAKSSDF